MSTEHFADAELGCRHCGELPPQEFQDQLEALRVAYSYPMRISSGFRCPGYNDIVSKTGRTGPHTTGAVDVLVLGDDAYNLIEDAIALGWTGIGISQKGPRASRFVHLDRLAGATRPWVWSY